MPKTFDDCPFSIEYRFVVPPANRTHVCITYNFSNRRWYAGIEDFNREQKRWDHRRGSASGHGTEGEAKDRAKMLWAREVEAQAPSLPPEDLPTSSWERIASDD